MNAISVKRNYGELLAGILPSVIHTEDENEQMLAAIAHLMKKGEEDLSLDESRLLELLSFLVEDYESKAHPIEKSEPLEVLRFLIEENKLKQKDLLPIFGSEGIISEVLKGKRNITAKHARALGEFFRVSPELFI